MNFQIKAPPYAQPRNEIRLTVKCTAINFRTKGTKTLQASRKNTDPMQRVRNCKFLTCQQQHWTLEVKEVTQNLRENNFQLRFLYPAKSTGQMTAKSKLKNLPPIHPFVRKSIGCFPPTQRGKPRKRRILIQKREASTGHGRGQHKVMLKETQGWQLPQRHKQLVKRVEQVEGLEEISYTVTAGIPTRFWNKNSQTSSWVVGHINIYKEN